MQWGGGGRFCPTFGCQGAELYECPSVLDNSATDLKASSSAVMRHNADDGRLDVGADETVEVVVRQLLHLVELLLDGARHIDVPSPKDLYGDERPLVGRDLDVDAAVAALAARRQVEDVVRQVV